VESNSARRHLKARRYLMEDSACKDDKKRHHHRPPIAARSPSAREECRWYWRLGESKLYAANMEQAPLPFRRSRKHQDCLLKPSLYDSVTLAGTLALRTTCARQ